MKQFILVIIQNIAQFVVVNLLSMMMTHANCGLISVKVDLKYNSIIKFDIPHMNSEFSFGA